MSNYYIILSANDKDGQMTHLRRGIDHDSNPSALPLGYLYRHVTECTNSHEAERLDCRHALSTAAYHRSMEYGLSNLLCDVE
jgi:hypothetical protein